MSISHKREIVMKNGRNRKVRPKTFKTEELAKKYAETNGMKDFDVVQLRDGLSSKFKVVQK